MPVFSGHGAQHVKSTGFYSHFVPSFAPALEMNVLAENAISFLAQGQIYSLARDPARSIAISRKKSDRKVWCLGHAYPVTLGAVSGHGDGAAHEAYD